MLIPPRQKKYTEKDIGSRLFHVAFNHLKTTTKRQKKKYTEGRDSVVVIESAKP